jgi:hypothetical protein
MATTQDDSFDPSQRRLCPDDACVGLVGPDGKCKVCGTVDPGWTGDMAAPTPPVPPAPEPEIDSEPAAPTASDEEVAFDPNRRLCPDDDCIGVIGSDNKCGVCGRRG